jgi:purine-nucleoside phosphorylase
MRPAPRFADLEAACREAPPAAAIVLGSGLGPVARRLRDPLSVPFAEIPGLPPASVAGHRGCLTLGEWAGRRVLVFEGRLHFYEGHPWESVVRPVRTAAALGARVAVLTNSAGGIAEALGPGSLMGVRDHLDLTRPHWWRHPGPGGLGHPRPPPYAPALLDRLADAARQTGAELHWGTYAALTGPCYETPAEVRALKAWGADAVGMSTAREAEAATDIGMQCAALSCVTNRAAGLSAGTLSHDEVLAVARSLCERVGDLLERFLLRLACLG